MVEKSSGIPSGPIEPLTPLHGITPTREKDREERTVPDRKKKGQAKKPPRGADDAPEPVEPNKDNKIDIRA
jgi:hypothetical protein